MKNTILYIRVGGELFLALLCLMVSTAPRVVNTDLSGHMVVGMLVFGCLPFIELLLRGIAKALEIR